MKKIYIPLLVIFYSFGLVAQIQPDESGISLSVILPDNTDNLRPSHITKIESKIQKMVTNYGISGQGYTNNFVIYPKYEIYDHTIVEGLKNVHIISAEFNLFVKELKTGKVYSSYSQSLKGDGYNRQKAINQSLINIKTRNEGIANFLNQAKQKIRAYYVASCDQISNDATSLITQRRYSEAIALLYSVPKEIGVCYEKIRQKTDEAYVAYQNQTCKEVILKAKAALAGNNYNRALTFLSKVDPSSECNADSESIIQQISFKVDLKENEAFKRQELYRKDRKELSILRMQNAKEIAMAYYKSKPQTVIYKSLF